MFIADVIVVACLALLALWLVDGWRSQAEYQGVTDTATSTTGDGNATTALMAPCSPTSTSFTTALLATHPKSTSNLPDGTVNTYTVFSTYVTENDPVSINPNVTNFADFARDMQGRSERQFATDPLSVTVANSANTGRNQQILTLSTCVANDDRRYLVHAVLTAVDQF